MARTTPFALFLTLLSPAAAQEAKAPAPVGFQDDFASDSRAAYARNGEVGWEKGKLTLSRAAISRRVSVGYLAEVHAVVRLPAGQATGRLFLSLIGPEKIQARIGLGAPGGKLELANLTPPGPAHVVTLEPAPPPAGTAGAAWALRLQLHFGLARAKAWRQGGPEPAQWQTTRYTGKTTWEPWLVGVGTGKSNDVHLISLAVTGTARAPVPSGEGKKALAKAGVLVREAAALFGQGKYEESLARQREALQLYRDGLPAGHPAQGPAVAATLEAIGSSLAALDHWDEALGHFRDALALYRKSLPDRHPAIARGLGHRGLTLRARGDLGEVRRDLEESLALYRETLPPGDLAVGGALHALGMFHRDLGRRDLAQSFLQEALAIRRKALGPDHPDLAGSLHELALLRHDLGEFASAGALYEEALSIFRKALSADHPTRATCLNNLGVLRQDQGRLGEARAYLERSLDARRRLRPRRPVDVAQSLNNLANVLAAQGELDQAVRRSEEALALNREALLPWHPTVAAGMLNLGLLRYDTASPAEGWRLVVEGAARDAEAAARLAAASAQSDHPYLTNRRLGLDALLSLAAQSGELSADQRRQLLDRVLDAKGISTRTVGQRLEAAVVGRDGEAARTLERLRGLRRRLAGLLLRGPGRELPGPYRALCADLQRQVDAVDADLARRVQGFADLARAGSANVAELAPWLPPGTVLIETVEYFHYDVKTPEGRRKPEGQRFAALLLWRPAEAGGGAQVRYVPLGAALPMRKAIRAWRERVQAGTVDVEAERSLRERLWEPLARALPTEVRRLVVAPDSTLALVPFEAIRLPDSKYLVERYEVSYVGTGRELMPRPRPARPSRLALLLADPDYDLVGASGDAGAPKADRVRPDGLPSGLRFARLPGFAREADAVARLLRGRDDWRVQALRGAGASEEKLAEAREPRLLYCVTHGFFLKDAEPTPGRSLLRDLELVGEGGRQVPDPRADPRLRSGLALAGANRWAERPARGLSDGLLTALEVENLDLWGTELVVLSACETGLGAVQVGEGVLGLRRAFQLAGARTVLASLWKVPDTETEQLMTSFLRRWLKGKGKAEALRNAQLDLIQALRASATRRQAPPLYWAGFVCHGDPR
jgi:CHAT domain-containing protein/tetratricopeptide (TPR) repeat protein